MVVSFLDADHPATILSQVDLSPSHYSGGYVHKARWFDAYLVGNSRGFVFTAFQPAVVPWNGRICGVTPGAMLVTVWIPAQVLHHALTCYRRVKVSAV